MNEQQNNTKKKYSEMFGFIKKSDTSIEVRADSKEALGIFMYIGLMSSFALDDIFGDADIQTILDSKYAFVITDSGFVTENQISKYNDDNNDDDDDDDDAYIDDDDEWQQ